MEGNLDKNNEVNKELADNTTNSNSEEIKVPQSEKVINMDINNGDSTTKVVLKNVFLFYNVINCFFYGRKFRQK